MVQEAEHLMQARAVAPGRRSVRNVYLPAQISVGAVLALNFLLLLDNLIPTRWGILGLEALLLLSLIITAPRDPREESRAHRRLQAALISLLAVANGVAVLQLARFLVLGGDANGRSLILSGLVVWMTNIVLFGLCFWELDCGGPRARSRSEDQPPDFQFPQMTDERLSVGWHPEFFDYLYVSFTNSTSLSPADTMPLSRRVKGLMLVQALTSFLLLALVVSRAVSILD